MRIITSLIIALFFITHLEAQVTKTVELTAGNLMTELTTEELNTITDLTITGTMDARDFKTMRDDMPVLAVLDMSQAQIIAYEGDGGTSDATNVYDADVIPQDAFHIVSIGKTSLQSVLIPLSTKVIGPWAFSRCTSLTSFDIPSSVTAIHAYAFATCYSITSLTIPESVETIERGAFTVCSALTSITIPSKVDSIQMRTFSGCEALTAIEIPSSVTYIGDQAFWFCASLETITIPSSVKTIGDLAFYECIGLKSITLSEGITQIGQSAFSQCTSLEGTVVLPESLTALENNIFESCSSLISVELPSSIDSIGEAAFLRCTNLETVSLPSSIVHIGNSAFAECNNLSGTLILPSSLKTIGYQAFAHCEKITGELVIPWGVTTIQPAAFTYCRSLTSLVIPSSVTSIEGEAFAYLSSLTSIEVQHLIPLSLHPAYGVFTGVDKSAVTLHVPMGTKDLYASAFGWKDFETVVEEPFGFQLNANSVNFGPEGGTDNSIEVTADFDWTATTEESWLSVSPSSAVTSQTLTITAEANTGLSSRKGTIVLSAAMFPNQSIHVTQLSEPLVVPVTPGGLSEALSEQEKQTISSLTLTGSMDARDFKTIHDQMPLLEELDITEVDIEAYTDTTFGNNLNHPANAIPFAIYEWNEDPQTSYSLSEHQKLAVIKLPHSLTTIGYRAFFACGGLTIVEMQSSVDSIGNEAFLYCNSLTSINLPTSVTSIGERAFESCSMLPSIELPSAIEKIDYSTFANCLSLESIVIPPSVTSIEDNAFTGCSSLQSVVIPSSLSIINRETFKDCSSLTSVVIPPLVTLIEEFAFRGCSALQTLSLPESLTAIEPAAFSDCISLDTIFTYAVNPPDIDSPGGWDVFDKVDKANCLLFVPRGTKEVYASAFGWKEFANITEMGEFSVSDTTVTIQAQENSQATVTLNSFLSWTAISDQEWLTVSPESGSGDQELTLTANANPSDSARTALVTVSANGFNPLTITVTQHGLTVGLDDIESSAQVKFYPNPFTEEVAIEITNPTRIDITAEVYSISGQKIKTLARARNEANISLIWDGFNEQGKQVMPGIYFCKVNGQAMKVVKR